MLVEINLLPRKEPKKFGFVVMMTVIISLFLLVIAFYLWQIHLTKNANDRMDSQIKITRKINATITNKKNTVITSNSSNKLKNALKWTTENRILTVPVMRHLNSLLPERGFINKFTYLESGTIEITVQFDSKREAAYYLESLNGSDWIEDASISALDADSSLSSSQTNGTSSGTNSENTSTSTAVDSNTEKPAKNSVSDIEPRYTGKFEIKFNQETIKKAINESQKDEKGVTGT